MRIAAASVTAAASVVRARSTRRGSKHVYEKNTTFGKSAQSAAAVLFVVKRYKRFEMCHFFRVLVKSYECCALQWCKVVCVFLE